MIETIITVILIEINSYIITKDNDNDTMMKIMLKIKIGKTIKQKKKEKIESM